jgi:hypothetical protein
VIIRDVRLDLSNPIQSKFAIYGWRLQQLVSGWSETSAEYFSFLENP